MAERQLKLLIVEDEANTRKLISMIIDWNALDIHIVGEACTGAEALDLIDDLLPDIVLTDIEMPYMDGLTLSQRILERYRDITIIILTAHEHFEYAQQALRAGVSNYLLKPLNRDSFEKTMGETVAAIRSRRALVGRMETSYNYMQGHRQFFVERLLSELVHKGLTEGMEDMLEMVNINFEKDSQYALALMNITKGEVPTFPAQKYFILNNCRDYFIKNYGESGKVHIFADGLDNLALLSYDPNMDLADVCRQMTNAIGDSLQCRLFFGVSDPVRNTDALPRAYVQASDALRLNRMSGNEPESYYVETWLKSLEEHSIEERVPDLLLFVKNGLGKQAAVLAVSLLRQVEAVSGKDLNAAKVFVIGVLSRAVETLVEEGILQLALLKQITPFYPQLLAQKSFSELKDMFTTQLKELCSLAEEQVRQKSGKTVSQIVAALADEYGNPELSLCYMARRFFFNSSYLSRVFKAHTGKSFSEYLLELRIHKACEMLNESDFKAYQLANLVGIPDPNYFAKCFKKVMSVSFQAYKLDPGIVFPYRQTDK
jgi:two-component system response regulator YesN